jgi:hypothetical protein
MTIKIENQASFKLPKNFLRDIEIIIKTLPREHLRGLDRLRIVDAISLPRVKDQSIYQDLPGIYHPKMGTQTAWLEIAAAKLLQNWKPFYKRLLPRLTLKGNLAAIIFSLVGQHYYLTLRHSTKKSQLEVVTRAYTEKHLRTWNQQNHKIRTRIFKPLQPSFEKWGRILQKKAEQEKQRKRMAD